MRISMDDWLRGCVYHDGRNGEVTLSADKVLEIADYIQQTRKSLADGCIEIPPTIVGKHADQMIIDEAVADTPQTESHITCYGTCTDKCGAYENGDCTLNAKIADTPQTDCPYREYPCDMCDEQTDCQWK